jgi:cellulose synthase/poly-beta-1,6-N-acetylglucosamine synthase-like glycosyltransferase
MPEAITRQNVFDPQGNDRCLAVVMPIYNEAATVNKIIPTVLAQPIVAQLIAVDDGSTDQTWEHLSALSGHGISASFYIDTK